MPLPYEEWTCALRGCHKSNAEKPGVEERYSFGIYAGRYHDACWLKSGYRDATDDNATFDPDYAGESLEPEEYYGSRDESWF